MRLFGELHEAKEVAGFVTMQTRMIDVRQTPTDLKELLALVATGAEVIFADGDTPIARLVPVRRRVAGLHAGTIWASPDFDAPLSEEFETGKG